MQGFSFLHIAENYDAFLCDLWGVIHDGDDLYDGVLESLAALHAMGKKLVFLSNAPRLAESIFTRMDAMGVQREWYLGGVTSGEGAIKYLKNLRGNVGEASRPSEPSASEASRNGSDSSRDRAQLKYYYLGLEKDEPVLEGIPQTRVSSIEEADFIYNGNFEFLGQSYAEIVPLITRAAERGLPMLCINPDLEVTKLDGTQILCAGYIAEEYIKRGGQVEYIGKPYPLVFEMGMGLLGNPPKSRVLMVGDNLMTDIKGGNAFGIDTAFVTQGILQNQKSGEQSVLDYCKACGVTPTHIIKSL